MQKTLCTLLFLLSFTANAQTGIYMKPTVGVGIGNVRNAYTDSKYLPALTGEIAIGFRIKQLRLETGIGYMNTGYKLEGLLFEDQFTSGNNATSTIRYHIKNIMVPFRTGYAIPVGEIVNLVPYLGLNLFYYLNSRSVMTNDATGEEKVSNAYKYVNKVTISAGAGLYAEIKLSAKTSLVVGPSLYYGINPVYKNSDGMLYNIVLNAGMKFEL